MKKIFLYVVMCVTTLGFMASCGDNEDVSAPHVLTDDEIAEIARQEEEESIARTKWDVAKMWEYETSFFVSANAYDGALVEIDTVEIAEYLGLTPEQLRKGIYNMRSGEWGAYDDDATAPKLTGFCINASTRQDDMTAYNTNGCWGHWWDENGDVTSWGDNARVFAEYDVEAGAFNVGQMPGLLVAGQDYTFVECIKYQDTRIGVMITVHAEGREEVKAEVVAEEDLTIEVNPRSDYTADILTFDHTKVLEALGVSSMSEVAIIGTKEDGTYAQEYTAGVGYWYNANGFVDAYENGSFFIEYYGTDAANVADFPDDEFTFYVGQMPNLLEGGFTTTAQIGFLANGKIALFNVTVNVLEYEDPETAPEGDPTTDTVIDVVIDKAWDNTYSNVKFDVKDVLREAFKMTTYQIHKAKNSGDLKIYIDEVSEEEPSYTSDVPGYWLDAEGKSVGWGETSLVFACLGSNETELWLYAGNHPESCVPNTTVTTKYLICCNGGMVTANITVNVGDAAE